MTHVTHDAHVAAIRPEEAGFTGPSRAEPSRAEPGQAEPSRPNPAGPNWPIPGRLARAGSPAAGQEGRRVSCVQARRLA
jgi:hypothetical protein